MEETHYINKPKVRGSFLSGANFLREIAVVVIGVAITFLVSGWVTNHREKKELRSHLEAVKTELETNLEIVYSNFEYYYTLVNLSDYIQSKPREEHTNSELVRVGTTKDGVNVMNVLYSTLPIQTIAFEGLKDSGTAKHIRNKSLWRSIMQSYKTLEELKDENDTYMSIKLNYFFNLISQDIISDDLVSPEMAPYYNFYRMKYTFNHVFIMAIRNIREALHQF